MGGVWIWLFMGFLVGMIVQWFVERVDNVRQRRKTEWAATLPQHWPEDPIQAAYDQVHNQDPRRKYSVEEVKSIVYPLIDTLEEATRGDRR